MSKPPDKEKLVLPDTPGAMLLRTKLLKEAPESKKLEDFAPSKMIVIAEREIQISIRKNFWGKTVKKMKLHFPKLATSQLCRLFGHTRKEYCKSQNDEYKCQAQAHLLLEMVQRERRFLRGIGGRKLLDMIGNAMKNKQLFSWQRGFFRPAPRQSFIDPALPG